MADYKTLTFGSVIADGVVRAWDESDDLTPATPISGAFRDTAVVVNDSRNRIYRLAVQLHLKKAGSVEFHQAAAAIRRLQGTTGAVVLKDSADVTKCSSDATWTCERVDPVEPLPGFGGRFTDQLIVRFIGVTDLTWA